MQRLEWSERYLIGHPRIDRQHRSLFDLANRLIDACGERPDREVVSDAFAALTEYALHHFHTEESLMEEVDFPDRHNHADLHLDFIERVGDLAVAAEKGGPDVLTGLAQYLRTWLDGHILGTDLLLKLYLDNIRAD